VRFGEVLNTDLVEENGSLYIRRLIVDIDDHTFTLAQRYWYQWVRFANPSYKTEKARNEEAPTWESA